MKYLWIIFILKFSPTLGDDDLKSHLCCDNEGNTMAKFGCDTDKDGVKTKIDLICDKKITLNKIEFPDEEYQILKNGSLYVDSFQLAIKYQE
jgi:hypothetical protein